MFIKQTNYTTKIKKSKKSETFFIYQQRKEKIKNSSLPKSTKLRGKDLIENNPVLLNKAKDRIKFPLPFGHLPFKEKDLFHKVRNINLSPILNWWKSLFLHRELQKTDRNLCFSTENYKKLTEISVSPQRITKNWRKSLFLHGELQKTDRNLRFSTENLLKPSAETISHTRNPYTSEKGSDFLLFFEDLKLNIPWKQANSLINSKLPCICRNFFDLYRQEVL